MINKDTTTNLKGLAILIVMIGHLVGIHRTTIDFDFRYFAAFAVSIFLILSGYGLSISNLNNGLTDFIKKRMLGVMLPYALATVFVSIAYGLLFTDPLRVIKTISLLNPTNPIDKTLWFVYFIFLWYAIFFVVYSLIKSRNGRVLTIVLISAIVYIIHPFRHFSQLNYQFTLHAFSFAVGIIIAEYNEKMSYRVLFVASVIIFAYSLSELLANYSMLSYEASCLSFGILIISLFSIFRFNFQPLHFIGMISYEMYLFEGVLLNVRFSENNIINALMFVFFTASIAYLFNTILTALKNHFTGILKSLKRMSK